MAEHRGRSPRTDSVLSSPPHSSIREHCERTCDAPILCDNFKILDSVNDVFSLRILESLYIFKYKPTLNDNNSSVQLNIVS